MLSKRNLIKAFVAMLIAAIALSAPALALNITYNAGAGTGPDVGPNDTAAFADIMAFAATNFTAPEGQVFNFWTKNATAETPAAYTEEDFTNDNAPGAEITLIAIYKDVPAAADTLDITYNAGAGTDAAGTAGATFGPTAADAFANITTFEATGFVAPDGQAFDFWTKNTTTPAAYDEATFNADLAAGLGVTLTAQYKVNTYTVTYDQNVTDPIGTYDHNATVTVMEAPAVASNLGVFDGWVTGDGTRYQPGDEFNITNNVSFTASFSKRYWYIIIDPLIPADEYAQLGGKEVVYKNFPAKDPVVSYKKTYQDGTSNDIHWLFERGIGATPKDEEEKGRWGLIARDARSLPYSLNLRPLEEDVIDPSNPDYKPYTTFPLPNRPGYIFDRWSLIDIKYEGEQGMAGDTYEFGRAVNQHAAIVAQWFEAVYNITYIDNGVVNGEDYAVNPKNYTVSSEFPTGQQFVNPVSKPGYGFCPCDPQGGVSGRQWVVQGHENIAIENITDIPSKFIENNILGDITLVAKSTPCEYDLAYIDSGEPIEGLAPVSFNISVPRALPKNGEVLNEVLGEDYSFGGWFLDDGLTKGPITHTSQIPIEVLNETTGEMESITDCPINLYLKKIPREYNITYHLGADDAVNPAENPKTYNATTSGVAILNGERPGYFFSGWLLDNVDGQFISTVTEDLDQYLLVDGVVKYRDIDLYAVWSDKMVKIIYMDIDIKNSLSLHDTNGILTGPFQQRNDLTPTTYDVSRVDTKLGVPAAPINQADIGAFNFLGWYLDEDWNREVSNKNESGWYVATDGIHGDITVYAKWEFAGDGYGIITYIPKNGENACEPGSPIWQEVVRDGTYANNYGHYNDAILQPGDAPMTRVTKDGRVFEFVGWNLAEPYERDGYCARLSQTVGCGADCAYNFDGAIVNENITLGGSWKLVSIPEPPEEDDPCADPCDPKPTGIVFRDAEGNVVYAGALENGELPEVDAPYVRGKIFLGWKVLGIEEGDAIPADAFVEPVYVDVPDLNGDGKVNIADVITLLQYYSGNGGALADKTPAEVVAIADFDGDDKITISDVIAMLKAI